MIVSHKYELIFIHLGKTGGDSITHALTDFCDESQNDIIKENQNVHKFFHKHAKAWEIQEAFLDMNWNYEDYFKFIVIRNPYEILHSDYWFHKFVGLRHYPNDPPEPGIKDYEWFLKCHKTKDMTFTDYVMDVYGYWDKGFISNWAKDRRQNIIIDYVCRNENLDQDFDYVCKKVGLPNICLEKVNKTEDVIYRKRPNPQEDFTPELIDFVEKIFAEEIRTYNYTLSGAK